MMDRFRLYVSLVGEAIKKLPIEEQRALGFWVDAKSPSPADVLETFRQGTDPQRVAAKWIEAEQDGSTDKTRREQILRDFNLKLKIRDRVKYGTAKAAMSLILRKQKTGTSKKRSKAK